MKAESARVLVAPLRTTRNGRRFFSEDHQRAVVERCLAPGALVAAVAMQHGFSANLVRKWIRRYQREWVKKGITLPRSSADRRYQQTPRD